MRTADAAKDNVVVQYVEKRLHAVVNYHSNSNARREHLTKLQKDIGLKALQRILQFDAFDVNKDGQIERSELRDAFVKYSALRQAIGEGPNFK